jgi:hypothetical protein
MEANKVLIRRSSYILSQMAVKLSAFILNKIFGTRFC